jgi:DNA-binding MarR family transcriptional regulator
MLDLLAAYLEGRRVSVSSLCIAAAVPATTALRYINQLERKGICVRHGDPEDRRRVFIDLAEEPRQALLRLMSSTPFKEINIPAFTIAETEGRKPG